MPTSQQKNIIHLILYQCESVPTGTPGVAHCTDDFVIMPMVSNWHNTTVHVHQLLFSVNRHSPNIQYGIQTSFKMFSFFWGQCLSFIKTSTSCQIIGVLYFNGLQSNISKWSPIKKGLDTNGTNFSPQTWSIRNFNKTLRFQNIFSKIIELPLDL